MPDQGYLVAARKYRPARFGEVVAQSHVTDTLKNAIRLDRLAQAFIFSGPRGVGKTTCARILAKAINCTTPLEEREDGAEPCLECASCRSFEEGRSLSVIEIDAASNRSVNDARQLRETVRIPPQGAQNKVYILDEVHMLTADAWNVLLKTIEEPPPHVLFIFATTEPNKVLPTILSRCQRFDFHRIAVQDVVDHLREICRQEGISADDESLLLIARKGDGALRDALSVFDQAVSLCGNELRYDELARAMGVVEHDLFFDVTDAVLERDSAAMFGIVERIVRRGYDLSEFLSGLTEHLRNALVLSSTGRDDLIDATEAMRARYRSLAERYEEAHILRLLALVDETSDQLRDAPQPRFKVELALTKMAHLAPAIDLREALEAIERLEEKAGDGKLVVATRPASEPAGAASKEEADETDAADSRPVERSATREVEEAPEEAGESASTPEASEEGDDRSEDGEGGLPVSPDDLTSDGPGGSGAETPSPEKAQESAKATSNLFGKAALKKRRRPDASDDSGSEAGASGDGQAGDPELVAVESPAGEIEQLRTAWPELVEQMRDYRVDVATMMSHARPTELRRSRLTVAVPDDLHRRLIDDHREQLIQLVNGSVETSVEHLLLTVDPELEGESGQETGAELDPYQFFERKRTEDPVVGALFDLFGGELVYQ